MDGYYYIFFVKRAAGRDARVHHAPEVYAYIQQYKIGNTSLSLSLYNNTDRELEAIR